MRRLCDIMGLGVLILSLLVLSGCDLLPKIKHNWELGTCTDSVKNLRPEG